LLTIILTFVDEHKPIKSLKAVGGILVAGTMKYADNILKTFATANSIALSCVLSHFLLGDDDTFTPTFLIGTCVIILATFLYSANSVPRKIEMQLINSE
jgi:UDP-sugar transporter A1/2/3